MAGFWGLQAAGVSYGRKSGPSTAMRAAQPPHCIPELNPVRAAQTYLRVAAIAVGETEEMLLGMWLEVHSWKVVMPVLEEG